MRILSLYLLLLGLLVTAAPSLAQVPLLEIEARGLRTTDVEISFCGPTCRDLYPRFLSYRLAFMTDGTAVGTLTENPLDDPSFGATTETFQGVASPQQAADLRSFLTAARIGFEPGGCSVVFAETVELKPYPKFNVYNLSYTVLWYGRGNRFNLFALPAGLPGCATSLRNLLRHAISVARDVQQSSRK